MTETMVLRWRFVSFGTLAGLVLWGLSDLPDGVPDRDKLIAAIIMGCTGFFSTLLLMTGRTQGGHAFRAASLVGLLSFAAMQFLGLRYAGAQWDYADFGHVMALWVIMTVPLPFLIAAGGAGWRDYPTLFEESWSAAIRAILAWMFVGVVWLLLFLSTTLLTLVGVTLLERLLEIKPVIHLISGASLGLGLAVVSELQNRIPSRVVVRLLRLLTPAVLAVAVVFVLAFVLRGFALKSGWSAGQIILSMAALSIMLVTLVADKHGAKETDSGVLRVSARGLALVVPVLAALALGAVVMRVRQYGWMPDRLLAALLSVLGLIYGAIYGVAAVRGGDWMARVRAANPGLMLMVLVAALLWVSPLVNAQKISAQSQKARILAIDDLSLGASPWQMRDLGLAGQAALDEVDAIGKAEGRADLVAWVQGNGDGYGAVSAAAEDTTALQKKVAAVLPVIPPEAVQTRDLILAHMQSYELRELLETCESTSPDGGWTCVLVVADLMPLAPGPEAVLGTRSLGWNKVEGLVLDGAQLTRGYMRSLDGSTLTSPEAEKLILDWQKGAPVVGQAALNQLGVGSAGVVFLP